MLSKIERFSKIERLITICGRAGLTSFTRVQEHWKEDLVLPPLGGVVACSDIERTIKAMSALTAPRLWSHTSNPEFFISSRGMDCSSS